MMVKVERFRNTSRMIFLDSQKFAEELKHPSIEPEHMLLAMTKLNDFFVCEVLNDAGIILEKLMPLIKSRIPENAPEKLDLSAATKKVLELSVDIARRYGHHTIMPEHLLIALMRLEHQGMEAIKSHFQVEVKEIVNAIEQYWDENSHLLYPHPLNPLADSELGCFEILRDTFGFGGKKKNDE